MGGDSWFWSLRSPEIAIIKKKSYTFSRVGNV